MVRRGLFVALVFAALPACASQEAGLPPIGAASLTPYQLGAGDEIRVAVFGLDALTNNYMVGDAGTISLPLVNEVPVQGHTTQELAAEIAQKLREKDVVKDPSVSVMVQKYRPFFILGEVQRPGQYPYVPGMSVMTAVSIAGGYTFRAKTQAATITRNAGGRITKGSAEQSTPIMPGDTVLVPEDWF